MMSTNQKNLPHLLLANISIPSSSSLLFKFLDTSFKFRAGGARLSDKILQLLLSALLLRIVHGTQGLQMQIADIRHIFIELAYFILDT